MWAVVRRQASVDSLLLGMWSGGGTSAGVDIMFLDWSVRVCWVCAQCVYCVCGVCVCVWLSGVCVCGVFYVMYMGCGVCKYMCGVCVCYGVYGIYV